MFLLIHSTTRHGGIINDDPPNNFCVEEELKDVEDGVDRLHNGAGLDNIFK